MIDTSPRRGGGPSLFAACVCGLVAACGCGLLGGCDAGSVLVGGDETPEVFGTPAPAGPRGGGGGGAAGAAPSATPTATELNREVAEARRALESSLPAGERRLAATVVVVNVPDTDGIDRYLKGRLSAVASAFHRELTKGSRDATEANRKRAEDAKRREVEAGRATPDNGFAGGMFGSTYRYEYKQVDPEIGSYRVNAGPVSGDRQVFTLFPVPDLRRVATLSDRFREVEVDESTRTVVLWADVPDPLPDEDLDRLRDSYPENKILRVTVRFVNDDNWAHKREEWFDLKLGGKAMSEDGDRTLVVAKHDWQGEVANSVKGGDGTYVYSVAPVEDPAGYVEKIDFGDVSDFNPETREVSLMARIPRDVGPDLAAAKSAGAGPRGSRLNTRGDREPADGESKFEWAVRVLVESDDGWAHRPALEHLLRTEPDELTGEQRAAAGDALLKYLRIADHWTTENALKALLLFKPEGYLAEVGSHLDQASWHEKDDLVKTLAGTGDPKVLEYVVPLAKDRHAGKAAVEAIRSFGGDAEPYVLPLLRDVDPAVRADAATLLGEIGGQRSLDALSDARRSESNREVKIRYAAARGAIRQRLGGSD